MGKFDNVLIASDLDGTLTNDNGIVDSENIIALRYFISEGGRFTVSTGRTYMGFHKYNPDYINAPVLLCNGAMAYDYATKEVIFQNGIDKSGIVAIEGIMQEFPDIPIEMYPFDNTFAIHLNSDSERHFTNQGIPFTIVDSPGCTVFPWIKAMLCAKEKTLEVQNYLQKMAFPGITFLPTTGSYIELLAPGVNKGSGLLRLSECLNIKQTDTYAVGDDYNDVEMLSAANKAFVPENGSPIAKSQADYIVRANSNGCIANVIEILDVLY